MKRGTTRERLDERMRLMQVYETFLRYGTDAAFDRGALGDFRHAMQTRLYRPERPVEQLSIPVKVRLLLQELGPKYVKFGQIVSSRADAVPQDWERELEKLQSDVRPFPVEQAREVVEAELGAPPETLYAAFDPVPLAAASLGQVHRATLEDGREVVVKVQRPHIEDKVRSDLRTLAQAARTMQRRASWARDMAIEDVIAEFGDTLPLELDYTIEAYNARRPAQNLAGIEGVHIPEVIRPLSTKRALHDGVRPGRYADVSFHSSARTTPGIVVHRLDDRLFFANARYFRARVHEAIRGAPDRVRWLVFDAEAVTHADSTGMEVVEELVDELTCAGIGLAVARLRTRMLERFETLGLVDTIGSDSFYPSVRAAVDACLAQMSLARQGAPSSDEDDDLDLAPRQDEAVPAARQRSGTQASDETR